MNMMTYHNSLHWMYTKASRISKTEFMLIYSCWAREGRKGGGDRREAEKQGERDRRIAAAQGSGPDSSSRPWSSGRMKKPLRQPGPFPQSQCPPDNPLTTNSPPGYHDTPTRRIPCKVSFWGLTHTNYIFQRLMCKLRY